MILGAHESLGLLTDLYQITMGYGYFKTGKHETRSVFHYYYRRNPFKGGFSVCAGLETFIEYLNRFSFSESDIGFLRGLTGNDNKPLFDEAYLSYLKDLKLTCTIDAIPEGTVVLPLEPMVRIEGPMIQCQLIETALLNIMNFQTLIATKAARIVAAAGGDDVFDFGLRRAQGMNGALAATRASYIGGCVGTSNVLAAKLLDIPTKGTHAHSWVMSFPNEQQAFEEYASALPNNCIFLVDTYDTHEGVKAAIAVAKKMKEKNHKLIGIRLDSGDLAAISIRARKQLDDADLRDVVIVASNDLDEYRIQELKMAGAKIDVWGVGTRLVTAFDDPALGGVYKLGGVFENNQWSYKTKVSEDAIKTSYPGHLQVGRVIKDGRWERDTLDLEASCTGERLLQPLYQNGKLIAKLPTLQQIQKRVKDQLKLFPAEMKRLDKTAVSGQVVISEPLKALRDQILPKK